MSFYVINVTMSFYVNSILCWSFKFLHTNMKYWLHYVALSYFMTWSYEFLYRLWLYTLYCLEMSLDTTLCLKFNIFWVSSYLSSLSWVFPESVPSPPESVPSPPESANEWPTESLSNPSRATLLIRCIL